MGLNIIDHFDLCHFLIVKLFYLDLVMISCSKNIEIRENIHDV